MAAVRRGIVTVSAGIGLIVFGIVDQDRDLYGMAAIAIAIGIGFLVSAYASYRLSHKLGLWQESGPQR